MQHANMDQGSPPPRPKRPPRQKKRRKRKKSRSRLTAPTAVRQGSPPGRGVFRMSLRASQVGKPRRQLSTSGPESAITARALTFVIYSTNKTMQSSNKARLGDPLPQAEWKFSSFHRPSPRAPGLPSKTAIACPARHGYRARKRDSGFHALTNAGWGALAVCPPRAVETIKTFRCPQNSKQRKRRKQQNNLDTLTSPKADREGARRQCGMGKLLTPR